MKRNIYFLLAFLFLIFSFSLYYYYSIYLPQQRQKQISELKQKIEQTKKEIERLQNFNEEEYAERVTKKLSCSFLFDSDKYFSTSTDIKLDGVDIVSNGRIKIVINKIAGYQITIPSNLILNRTCDPFYLNFDDLELIGSNVPTRYWNALSIKLYLKEDDPKLFDQILQEDQKSIEGKEYISGIAQENRLFKTTTKSEKIDIDNKEFYKVIYTLLELDPRTGQPLEDAKPFEGEFGYFFIGKDKIFEIRLYQKDLENYVKTFKFINQNG